MNKRTFAPLVALLALSAPAFGQAGLKLNGFPAASALSGADLVPVGQGGAGVTYKSTVGAISSYVLNSGGLGGDCTITALTIYCTKTNGVSFGTLAVANAATPPILGGTTPNAGHFTTLSATGLLSTAASGTSGAGLNLPQGVAPTSPNNGDVWVTPSGMFVRANGTTIGPFATGGGSGTVTTASVVSANGFAGTVANPTTTPAITLSTSVTGILKGNGTAISAAANGTDYTLVTANTCGAGNHVSAVSAAGIVTCSADSGGGTTANPTATASDVAVNGTATTLMRSDAAPAIQKATSSQFGLMKCDNVTVACPGGVVQSNGQVVDLPTGTTNVTTAQWGAGTTFRAKVSGTTLVLPASSTLSPNGGIAIQTSWGQSLTVSPNAADAINGGTTGANVTVAAALTAYVSSDGVSAIGASPLVTGSSTGCTVSGSQFQILAVNSAGTGCTADGSASVNVGALSLGSSGTAGSVALGNATSGTVTVQPVTGALGSVTASLPANTGTVAELNLAQAWTATQTFAGVLGSSRPVSITTDTLSAADCGKTIIFTSASAVTVTIPASIVPAVNTVCAIAILQSGAGQVSVNGTAVSAATLVSAHSYTKTFGTSAMIGLTLTTVGATATAILTGDGA